MVKYSNRGLSNDPSNLWLFGVLYWILYLSLEAWTQSILLGKFFFEERDYLTFSKQAIRYFIDILVLFKCWANLLDLTWLYASIFEV